MRLAVLSLATAPFAKFREISFPNKQSYCERHGYTWVGETETRDPSRPASWSKILMLAELCHTKSADWAWWSDADSAVTRPGFKVASLCTDDADLVLTRDENGINCGQMLWRICDQSLWLLEEVYRQRQFIHHQFWEQKSLSFILAKEPPWTSLRVRYEDKAFFNSYPSDWRRGYSFIMHAPGNPRWPDRIGELRRALELSTLPNPIRI